jgi:hypothetical protein
MCVIMSSGPGVPAPPYDHLVNANEANPHGWGVAVNLPKACKMHSRSMSTLRPEGQPSVSCKACRVLSTVLVERGFTTEELIVSVNDAEALRTTNPLASLVVHTRIATGTPVTIANTHPFEVTETLQLFHNGIFSELALPVTDKLKPDSWHLAQLIKPHILTQASYFLAGPFKQWLDEFCKVGYSNKILLLDAVSGSAIYNESAWVNGLEGRLYSNSTPMEIPWEPIIDYTRKDEITYEQAMYDLDNPWGYYETGDYYTSKYEEVNPWEPLVKAPTTAERLREEILAQKNAGISIDDIIGSLAEAKRGCNR